MLVKIVIDTERLGTESTYELAVILERLADQLYAMRALGHPRVIDGDHMGIHDKNGKPVGRFSVSKEEPVEA